MLVLIFMVNEVGTGVTGSKCGSVLVSVDKVFMGVLLTLAGITFNGSD